MSSSQRHKMDGLKKYSKREKKSQKYAFCIVLEEVDGEEIERKTVVPRRWLDVDEMILFWPNSESNVESKKFCDPDELWLQFPLVKVLVEGDEELCNDLLNQSSSSEAEISKKPSVSIQNENRESLPKSTKKSVMSVLKKSASTPKQSHRSPMQLSSSLPPSSSKTAPRRHSPPLFSSTSKARASSVSHSRSRSKSCSRSRSRSRTRSRSRSHSRSRSPSPDFSRSPSPIPFDSPAPESNGKKAARKDSANSLKNKFPMMDADFQRRVLSYMKSNDSNRSGFRKSDCKCPCSCGSESNPLNDFRTINSIDQLDGLEEKIQKKEEFDLLVTQLKWFGGKNLKDIVKTIMARLMSDDVKSKFNMTGINRGEKNKKAFQNKKICAAIIESVRQQENVTESVIKELIADNLRFAPFRKKKNVESSNENV